jgi:ABC-2 type transport system permease protein
MSRAVGLLAGRELASALRGRWFWAYSLVFVVAGLGFVVFAPADAAVYGYRGFAKALVGVVHLALLFVPLMALFPAAAALAEERENGVLEYLLAQPVDGGEVYSGKWLGLAVSVLSSITLGFLVAAGAALWRGVPWLLVVTLYLFVALLALVFVSLGLWLSSVSATRARATTLGISVWLVFAALGTLGLMLAFVRLGVPEWLLVGWALVNPVEAFRLGVVVAVDGDASLLGPVGVALVERLGALGIGFLAAASLLGWVVAAWWAGRWRGLKM